MRVVPLPALDQIAQQFQLGLIVFQRAHSLFIRRIQQRDIRRLARGFSLEFFARALQGGTAHPGSAYLREHGVHLRTKALTGRRTGKTLQLILIALYHPAQQHNFGKRIQRAHARALHCVVRKAAETCDFYIESAFQAKAFEYGSLVRERETIGHYHQMARAAHVIFFQSVEYRRRCQGIGQNNFKHYTNNLPNIADKVNIYFEFCFANSRAYDIMGI